jgi:hypothetical protein
MVPAVSRCAGKEKKSAIKQADVDRYVELDRAEKRAKAEKEKLRAELLPALRNGECPAGGPHVLTLSAYDEKRVDWKTELLAFANKWIGEGGAAELVKKLEDEAAPKATEKVLIKENIHYKASVADVTK